MRVSGIGNRTLIATQTLPVPLDLGFTEIEEPFWYLPNNGEGSVLGMDIMAKYGFVIQCSEKQIAVTTGEATRGSQLDMARVLSISNTDPVQHLIDKHDSVWAKDKNDCGRVNLEVSIPGNPHPPQKQYRIKPEAETAVQEIVNGLEKRGVVRRCNSATNSPICPVPKPNGSWRLTIDYKQLNKHLTKATQIVANPSTLLSEVCKEANWFSVLDAANGYWSIPIKREDQWKTAFTVNQIQYCWERMPQGWQDSASVFHRAMADALEPLMGTGEVLHYVDDILVATAGTRVEHLNMVDTVLQKLGDAGFLMNKAKAQIACEEVQYLGYTLSQNSKALTESRRKCIAELPRPYTRNALQKVLGTANFLRDFIPDFACVTTPLYGLLKGTSKPSDTLDWTEECGQAFTDLKQKLCSAPALGLPNADKPFHIQVDVHTDTLSGVLAQDHGGKLRPVAYYSRKKSPVEQGFDPCTQHVLAVHWMLTTTEPFVGFTAVVVHTMHTPVQMLLQGRIKGVSSQRVARWLTDMQAREITVVNNRILPHLLGDIMGSSHVCETRAEMPSAVADCELAGQTRVYIDGSRFWEDGNFHTGSAVWAPHVTEGEGAKQLLFKLPPTMSAQQAELVALLQALKAHPEPMCVYTDSRYVHGVTHDFMAQWQLRKFLTAAGQPIKHQDLIMQIWQHVQAREHPLSVVKVRAHVSNTVDVHELNNKVADTLAKEAASHGTDWLPDGPCESQPVSAVRVTPIDLKEYQKDLWISDGELKPELKQDALITVKEGLILREDKYVVPGALYRPIIKLYHDYAHVSADKTSELIKRQFWWPSMADDVNDWCHSCLVCASVNSGKQGRTKLRRPAPPRGPWESLQLDFVGPLPSTRGGYRYCLVIIDKFSKWVECIPTRNNSAHTVARILANQIVPLWGSVYQIDSDLGGHFTAKVMEDVYVRC